MSVQLLNINLIGCYHATMPPYYRTIKHSTNQTKMFLKMVSGQVRTPNSKDTKSKSSRLDRVLKYIQNNLEQLW